GVGHRRALAEGTALSCTADDLFGCRNQRRGGSERRLLAPAMLLAARKTGAREPFGSRYPALDPILPQSRRVDRGVEPDRDTRNQPPRDAERQRALFFGQPLCGRRREIV